MVGGVPDAGQDEEVAATGRADVVDQRFIDEPGLGRLELAGDVLLVAAEGQAHVEVAVGVDAPVVVVAAAQDTGAGGLGGAGVGQPDVRVERDDLSVGVARVVRGVGLGGAVQRRAGVPAPADHHFLLVEGDPVPELHQHPDDPDDLVGAACGPGGLVAAVHPDQPVQLGGAGHVRIGDAVLEAEQVALGSRRPGLVLEAVDAPPQLHAAAGVPGDVTQRVQHGVAAVRTQLKADVAMALRGVQVVVGEGAHRCEVTRRSVGQAEAVVEQGCAHTDGDGQRVRGHHGPDDAAVRRRGGRAEVDRGAPGSQETGPFGDCPEQVDKPGPVRRDRVEGREHRRRRWWCDDPGLVGPVEGDHLVGAPGAAGVGVGGGGGGQRGARGAHGRARGQRASEKGAAPERAPGEPSAAPGHRTAGGGCGGGVSGGCLPRRR